MRIPNSPQPPLPHHHPEAGPSRNTIWRNVDISAWDFSENPFKRIHNEWEDLQTQYYRLEHITKGANRALDNCGRENVPWSNHPSLGLVFALDRDYLNILGNQPSTIFKFKQEFPKSCFETHPGLISETST